MFKHIYILLLAICSLPISVLAEYTADDYDRLVKENPIVVAGIIEKREEITGVIKVIHVIKCELGDIKIGSGDEIALGKTPLNRGAVASKISYPEEHVGVWILKAEVAEKKIQPAEIVVHYIFPESMVIPGKEDPEPEEIDMKSQWGVTAADQTSYYSSKGKNLGILKPGTVFDITKTAETDIGVIAVCKPDGLDNIKTDFVVRTCDIMIYPGKVEQISDEAMKIYVKDALLQAQIEREKELVVRKMAGRNPYKASYEKSKAEYDKFWAKIADLQKKRDAYSKGTHMKYADELRMLKGQDIAIGQKLQEAKGKYEDWNKRNNIDASKVTSPKIKQLQKELKQLRSQ